MAEQRENGMAEQREDRWQSRVKTGRQGRREPSGCGRGFGILGDFLMIIAKEFTEHDKEQLFDMIQEINEYDANFEGLEDMGRIGDYNLFLKKLEQWKYQERINSNYSPQTTFGVFDHERLVGGFVLRHKLKGALMSHGGNIGYLVRPSERGKGYGRTLLKLALEKAINIGLEKVLVTCREDNIGSIKVIESNSGKYENDYYDENIGKIYRRYWIECK